MLQPALWVACKRVPVGSQSFHPTGYVDRLTLRPNFERLEWLWREKFASPAAPVVVVVVAAAAAEASAPIDVAFLSNQNWSQLRWDERFTRCCWCWWWFSFQSFRVLIISAALTLTIDHRNDGFRAEEDDCLSGHRHLTQPRKESIWRLRERVREKSRVCAAHIINLTISLSHSLLHAEMFARGKMLAVWWSQSMYGCVCVCRYGLVWGWMGMLNWECVSEY